MMVKGSGTAKRIVLEIIGWSLVVVGIAALILPGPGLLALAGGLAILSQQYEWAERRVRPVERRAKQAAAESVQSVFRITLSLLLVAWLCAMGVLWILQPAAPEWWPVKDSWWLFGGPWTGVTLIGSGLIALAMIVYSIRTYRGLTEEELRARVDASVEG